MSLKKAREVIRKEAKAIASLEGKLTKEFSGSGSDFKLPGKSNSNRNG